jgi:hypothetical protein
MRPGGRPLGGRFFSAPMWPSPLTGNSALLYSEDRQQQAEDDGRPAADEMLRRAVAW